LFAIGSLASLMVVINPEDAQSAPFPFARFFAGLAIIGGVVTPRVVKDPKDPTKSYTSWFDIWRFVDGKAYERWDGATKETF
ncbi:MAG: hypothetical protein J2P21_16200, partial [Chloracidobacterium sp.]|nr:hypothetical protein [Chloracidobacterium sp.]